LRTLTATSSPLATAADACFANSADADDHKSGEKLARHDMDVIAEKRGAVSIASG
jgi:hypothetical protein